MKIIRSGIHLQRNPIPNKMCIYIHGINFRCGRWKFIGQQKGGKKSVVEIVFGKRETIIHIIIIDLFKYKHHNYHYEYKIV